MAIPSGGITALSVTPKSAAKTTATCWLADCQAH